MENNIKNRELVAPLYPFQAIEENNRNSIYFDCDGHRNYFRNKVAKDFIINQSQVY